MKIEIRGRYGSPAFSGEYASTFAALNAAAKSGASFLCANLYNVDLRGLWWSDARRAWDSGVSYGKTLARDRYLFAGFLLGLLASGLIAFVVVSLKG